jgi:hypothetical protein
LPAPTGAAPGRFEIIVEHGLGVSTMAARRPERNQQALLFHPIQRAQADAQVLDSLTGGEQGACPIACATVRLDRAFPRWFVHHHILATAIKKGRSVIREE